MAAPAQVTNVAAAGINQGIIATWTISPEVDVAGYQTRVTQAGAQVRDWTNVAGDRMTAAVIIGGLTNGLAYAVTVRAVNSSNEFSMASAEATATPVDVVLRQVYEDVDLTGLAPPPVVEQLGYEAILTAMTADLRARDPDFDAWVESEPVMKLLEIAAYRELLLRYRINQAARSVMLAYAAGADLDHLGALLGVTRSTGETDEQLRARIRLAPARVSTAGSEASYRFWVTSVPGVTDVQVDSPSPGVVDVWALGGDAPDGSPPPALVLAVADAISGDTVRPLTDTVRARTGRVRPYAIAATVTVASGPDVETVRTAAAAAVTAYARRQRKLGGSVPRSALIAALHVAGVVEVDLTEPAADVDAVTGQAPWPTTGANAVYEYPDTHPLDGIAVVAA